MRTDVDARPDVLPAVAAQLAQGQTLDFPVVIVAAHPDDETLGLGGRLHRLGDCRLIHLTDGAPRDPGDASRNGFSKREDYAQARRAELAAALSTLAATPELSTYECPDQEGVDHLVPLTHRLADDLCAAHAVFTHSYEHGHPDHDAAAFCVHAACALLRQRGLPAPQIVEFTGYHLRDGRLICGSFWPDPLRREYLATLASGERARKQRALECFTTQRDFLQRFAPQVERYRLAPDYDFRAPAPPQAAFYETLGWPLTRAHWQHRAAQALTELQLRNRDCR